MWVAIDESSTDGPEIPGFPDRPRVGYPGTRGRRRGTWGLYNADDLWLTAARNMDAREIAGAVGSYLKDHPEELWRLLRNALALRFGVPLAALRYLALKGAGKKAPKDVQIDAVPPGMRVSKPGSATHESRSDTRRRTSSSGSCVRRCSGKAMLSPTVR